MHKVYWKKFIKFYTKISKKSSTYTTLIIMLILTGEMSAQTSTDNNVVLYGYLHVSVDFLVAGSVECLFTYRLI